MFNSRLKGSYLLFIAFVSGAAVMTMEITAARLLAPYFGTSIFIWTNIIGIVLIALSAGYYIGGKIADRRPELNIVLSIMAIAGVLGLLIPWVVRPVAGYLTLDTLFLQSGGGLFIFVSSFIVSLVIFAVPLCLLGMVSPFIIKLYASEHRVGESSGVVFAVSTIGSIVGTYLPTLWLVPTFGTNATISSAGAALLAVAAWGLLKNTGARVAVVGIALASTAFSGGLSVRAGAGTLYEGDSLYQHIRVDKLPTGEVQLKYNEGIGIQSALVPGRILTGYYHDYYQTLPLFFEHDRGLNVLIIGLAGGTISRGLYELYGGRISIDGVEIDPKVTDLAKTYFDMPHPNLTVYTEDGVVFLNRTKKKYDIIIVDAYRDQLYIPWTMTTKEFWQHASEKLTPDGVIAINVIGDAESQLVRAIMNTQASVVKNVSAVQAGGANLNMMLIGSSRAIDFDALRDRDLPDELKPIADDVAENAEAIEYDPAGVILTNDRAPVEFMTDSLIFGR